MHYHIFGDAFMDLGKNIESYRKKKKWTQDDLAKALGLSQPYICRIENNSVSISLDLLEKIGNVLGFTVKVTISRKKKKTN